MERCPVCRGRVDDKAQCGRCGADLKLVTQIRSDVDDLTLKAIRSMENQQFAQAERSLAQALTLEYSSFRQQLLGFVRRELEQLEKASGGEKTSFLQLLVKPFCWKR